MKFLCVCQDGNVRSHAMAYRLHNKHGHEAIPVGWKRISPATMAYFCAWADHVILMQEEFRAYIPEAYHDKVLVCDVGRDRYGVKMSDALQAQTIAWMEAHPEFR